MSEAKWPYDLAIVDVDNILYDFSIPLYNELKRINPNIPSPHHWYEWDFAFAYMRKDVFYSVVDHIHKLQSIYTPLDGVSDLMSFLKSHCKVIIASHRRPDRIKELELWLDYWKIPYDDINISQDKTKLFTPSSLVIDDSPEILQFCYLNDIACRGLDYPWNRRRINMLSLDDTLWEMLDLFKTMS